MHPFWWWWAGCDQAQPLPGCWKLAGRMLLSAAAGPVSPAQPPAQPGSHETCSCTAALETACGCARPMPICWANTGSQPLEQELCNAIIRLLRESLTQLPLDRDTTAPRPEQDVPHACGLSRRCIQGLQMPGTWCTALTALLWNNDVLLMRLKLRCIALFGLSRTYRHDARSRACTTKARCQSLT